MKLLITLEKYKRYWEATLMIEQVNSHDIKKHINHFREEKPTWMQCSILFLSSILNRCRICSHIYHGSAAVAFIYVCMRQYSLVHVSFGFSHPVNATLHLPWAVLVDKWNNYSNYRHSCLVSVSALHTGAYFNLSFLPAAQREMKG